jgi:hypothetical protein
MARARLRDSHFGDAVGLHHKPNPGCTYPMRPRKHRRPAPPQIGARGQAVIDRLLAMVSDLEPCEHDKDGFALWISTRPAHLLCGFCYQAAHVLAQDIRCAACASQAGDPEHDAAVIAKISHELGARFYLCGACADAELPSG